MPQAEKLTFPALSMLVALPSFVCHASWEWYVYLPPVAIYVGFPPSPVQNVTVISHVVKGNILELHVTWAPPVVTNGALWRYLVYVWHLPQPDAKQSIAISVSMGSALRLSHMGSVGQLQCTIHEYVECCIASPFLGWQCNNVFPFQRNNSWQSPVHNGKLYLWCLDGWRTCTVGPLLLSCYPMLLKIRAENFFQASNWSTPILLNIESSPQEQGVPEGVIYGLSVIAALIAVLLVIIFVLSVVLYLQRRKHKVVFLEVRPSWWCSCQLNDCTISVVSIHHWWLLLPPVLPPSTKSSFLFHCAGYWSRV